MIEIDYDDTPQVKIERALIAYLKTYQGDGGPLDPVTFYPGHWSGDLIKYPRCVITFANASGEDVAYLGDYECRGEALLSWSTKDGNGSKYQMALLAVLNQTMLPAVQAVTNKPLTGPDNRAVKQFGLDSIKIGDQAEGRDDKDNKHGARIPLIVYAHNELT